MAFTKEQLTALQSDYQQQLETSNTNIVTLTNQIANIQELLTSEQENNASITATLTEIGTELAGI